ncbi:MAG: hypothetical protein U0X91_09730 [Spirosomataceae bacterium]
MSILAPYDFTCNPKTALQRRAVVSLSPRWEKEFLKSSPTWRGRDVGPFGWGGL